MPPKIELEYDLELQNHLDFEYDLKPLNDLEL